MPLGNFVNCIDFSTTNGPGVTKEMWSVISSNKPWITLLVDANFLRFLMVQEFLHRPSWHLDCTSKNRNTFGHQKPLLQMEAYKFGSSNFVISYQTRLPARFCWHQHKKSSNITELPSIQLAKGQCNGASFRSCWFSNRCQRAWFFVQKKSLQFQRCLEKKSNLNQEMCEMFCWAFSCFKPTPPEFFPPKTATFWAETPINFGIPTATAWSIILKCSIHGICHTSVRTCNFFGGRNFPRSGSSGIFGDWPTKVF